MRRAFVHRLEAAAPDDLSGFDAALAAGVIEPREVLAVLGKTEGNGGVNDFSRGLATAAWQRRLGELLGADAEQVALVMSGGTEGGLAPHWLVLERRAAGAAEREGEAALAIGLARTRPLVPSEIGRPTQADLVADAVAAACAEAAIEQVHYVQIKCPLLTAGRIAQATAAGQGVATTDTLRSMGLSRAAAARGVAQALGEGEWSAVASASAGIELLGNEVVVLGMSRAWSGPLAIDHGVMADAFDVEPVRLTLERLGLDGNGQLPARRRHRVVALLAKAEASPDGRIRGVRHTMLDDSDLSATRHARALVGGVLGGLIGHGSLFVSGGAEGQGPPGGDPVAIIVDRGAG